MQNKKQTFNAIHSEGTKNIAKACVSMETELSSEEGCSVKSEQPMKAKIDENSGKITILSS